MLFKKLFLAFIAFGLAFSTSLFAEVNIDEQLLVPNFSSKLFKPIANEKIRSIIIRVCAKQQDYHLLLKKDSDLETKQKIYSIDLFFEKAGSGFLDVEASVVDLGTMKKVKRVSKRKFSTGELFRTTELALEVLFNLRPMADLNPPEKAKAARKKAIAKKNEENVVAFRERIIALKKGIAVEYKERAERKEREDLEKEEKELADGDGEDRESKKKKQENSSGGQVSIAQAEKKEKKPKKEKEEKLWSKSFAFEAGLESQNYEVSDQVGSVAEVSIGTNIQYLSLGGSMNLTYAPVSFADLYLKGEVLYPVREDEQVDASSAMNFSLGTRVFIEPIYTTLQVGLDKTTAMFGALPTVGGGLQLAVYDIYWLGVYLQADVHPKWSLFAQTGMFITAQGANEFSTPEEFEASQFSFGGHVDTNQYWKGSKLILKASLFEFVNQSGFGTKGESFNLTASVGKNF